MSVMCNINQIPTEFHVHQLNDFFIIIITLEENSNIIYDKEVEQNFWLRLNYKKSSGAMYFIFIKFLFIFNNVFAVVAPLPPKNGEKRRPEIRLLFAGYIYNW